MQGFVSLPSRRELAAQAPLIEDGPGFYADIRGLPGPQKNPASPGTSLDSVLDRICLSPARECLTCELA